MFIRLDNTTERDGQTDGQTGRKTARSYYNGLHSQQFKRALK